MKKNYITPEINVIQPESLLCSGGFMVASVRTNGEECIDNFDVVNEDATKGGNDYKGLWGESNSGNWGED
ncbi:MAG: hypothetical protein U0K56_07325 [Bacteroidaceae bacterium]|nr:hypothetical protein [Bacteroidaceae bacterium]